MIRASADPITRGEKKRALLQERERGTMFAAWQGRQAGGGKKERTTGREPSSEQMCRENQAASVGGSAKAPRPSYPVQLQFLLLCRRYAVSEAGVINLGAGVWPTFCRPRQFSTRLNVQHDRPHYQILSTIADKCGWNAVVSARSIW
ncbi:uncharacterized protein AKAW2_30396A [Aspergillus luchuensis]|uniref:Uncharacterized protein n=1 Tax=Aspergillus kawachii TaxID=1069201 RepID=A0A7R7W647_ASPKA|nr:uncharacterized protein AKAW2_30396A [Aspergillus luchuensis]BCR97077.1 hypothetical protein AKAW2_30396A [Aspergillus luchuensis]